MFFDWGTSGTRVYTWNSPLYYSDGPFFAFGRAEFIGAIFSCGESLNHVTIAIGPCSLERIGFDG